VDGIWITELAPGPAGRRLAVKDLFDTAGLRTTYGSAVFSDHVPSASADAVLRLEAAGWVNAGKANLHEFAYGVTSQNLHYGTVRNPARPGLTAGGSSGGCAAALALGQVDGALGTDTGGSVRIPAACCNVVGFKPSYGLIPIGGVFPLAPSFDHAGPLAQDVATCVRLMRDLAPGFEIGPVGRVRVATTWGREAVAVAAAALGGGPEVEFPTAEDVVPAFMREVADVHRELYDESAELYGENIRVKIERCLAVTDGEYAEAAAARERHRERAEAALSGFDLLLAPTLSIAPPPADVVELDVRAAMTRFTFPFNSLGWPSLALPVGDDSVQIVGRAGDDALVLAAGLAIEDALGR
jgi:aspartyl-tRNA(Asn)/glutamyl-tRNA(Gln) amidotransferase subunit A